MSLPKGYIEVTCLSDGKPALIRTDSIISVYDLDEEVDDGAVRSAHVQIVTSGGTNLRVADTYEEIRQKIWESEF